GTKILALDVFVNHGGEWRASTSDMLAAIDWVIMKQRTYNIRALNMSIGGDEHYTSECDSSLAGPFEVARRAGILPVVSAGNAAYVNGVYNDGVSYPACSPNAVRVGAVYDANVGNNVPWLLKVNTCVDPTSAADEITCFSQSGQLLSILAPGALITAAGLTQGGTSQAAPHVSGAAAVIAAAKTPPASLVEVERALLGSGPVITDPRNGVARRRLDLWAAVASIPEYRAPGDFDGDDKTDIASYDHNNAMLSIHKSSDGLNYSVGPFGGGHEYIPLAGDYDGDGRSDLAVYNKNTVMWSIKLATGTAYSYGPFGAWPENVVPLPR
ncbi:MAG TPA: S8 family serine peptidase, partial [Solirubrobacter sp.]|nr:S8 family serine peptidase [Solirubrobacter sp.]